MSYFTKFRSWLLTDTGKRFCYYLTGGASTAVMCGYFLPHTIFLDQYKDILHLYKNGFSVPLTPKLQETFSKALELAEIPARDRHLYKPFACYGFDIFSAGTSYSKYGVIVGLPANFFYENEYSVTRDSIKLRNDESIIWELEEAQLLQKSLVLSEKAQIYAIAKEIKFRDTPKVLIDTLVALTSFLGVYGISNAYNKKLNLYAKPLGVRLVLYSLVGALAFGSYAFCKDVSTVYYEKSADEQLKAINPIFVEGGREFYTKILNRNRALRKLLGEEGEKIYSVLGNENYFIRHRHMPLVQRRALFETENPA